MKLLKVLKKYISKVPKEPEENGLPPYADYNDLKRCTEIVREELRNRDIIVNDDILKKITVDIMGISYAKGGGYSEAIMRSFAGTYIVTGLYNKFLTNENEQEKNRKRNYCFEEIKEEVLKWYQSCVSNGAEYMKLVRNEDEGVIIGLSFDSCKAQITVSDTANIPCNMVVFNAAAFNPHKNVSEQIYYFFDSEDSTIEDVMNGLNTGIAYCLKFKGIGK